MSHKDIYTKYTDEWFLDKYFFYGSVEKALLQETLPISPATFHRLLSEYGIVGSPGRNTSLPEVLHFFKEKALAPGTPLEELYKSMPHTFQTSLVTLHRIYHLIEQNTVRRHAVALIIRDEITNKILVGAECMENTRYGKTRGSLTIPMGFSRESEAPIDSIFRILQQEVSTVGTIAGYLSKGNILYKKLLQNTLTPLTYFHLIDTSVAVYEFSLDKKELAPLSSYKLVNHTFLTKAEVLNRSDLRLGVSEILECSMGNSEPSISLSRLNQMVLLGL